MNAKRIAADPISEKRLEEIVISIQGTFISAFCIVMPK